MRFLRTSVVIIGLAPGMASAQDWMPLNPETVASYCFYGGTLYSIGARLCVPATQGSFTLVCKSPTEDNDAAKTGRAVAVRRRAAVTDVYIHIITLIAERFPRRSCV